MIKDLTDVFTNFIEEPHNDLDSIVSAMSVRIMGQGRTRVDYDQVNDFMMPSFLAVYYYSGSVQITHETNHFNITPGTFFIFEPYEIYSGIRISEEPVDYIFVNFEISPFSSRNVFKQNVFAISDAMFKDPWYTEIGRSLEGFFRADNSRPGKKVLLEHAVKGMVMYTLFDAIKKSSLPFTSNKKDSSLIDSAFLYVEEHLDRPINISNITKAIHTSKTTLDRVFANVIHVSPMKALTMYKMEKAITMLNQGYSVSQVSKDLGYSSSFHFSNTFYSIMGKRPKYFTKGNTIK